jgi:hypothetical protein
MLGFRTVRYAKIPPHRDIFERYGEMVVQLMIAPNFAPRVKGLQWYNDPATLENAELWLTERADIHANHERRIEIVEWAILIFVILGVIFESGLVRYIRYHLF